MKKTILLIITAALAIASAATITGCSASARENPVEITQQAVSQPTSEVSAADKLVDNLENETLTSESAENQTTPEDNAQTIETAVQKNGSDVSYTNYRSNSPAFRALCDKLVECAENGATGYTVCKLHGSDYSYLVVSFGESEMARYYEVYEIDTDGISYEGQLAGSNTVAYIDTDTCRLCLAYGHMGVYSCGPVCVDGGLRVDYGEKTVVSADQSYPELHGEALSFTAMDNFALIANF